MKGKQRSFITDRLKADRRALEKKRKAEARGRKHLREPEILDSLIAPPASCQLPPPACAAQACTLRAARLKEEPPHPSRWQTSPGPHHGIIVHVLLELRLDCKLTDMASCDPSFCSMECCKSVTTTPE